MKIKIKREGGFIGITSKANLDYDELTEAEQTALNNLAEQSLQGDDKANGERDNNAASSETKEVKSKESDYVKSDSKTRNLESDESNNLQNGLEVAENPYHHNTQNGMMRDAFSYSISMKKDGKTVSLKFDDMTAPPELVKIFQKYVQY